ncbi:MAG TPA: hypothetical protein VFS92_10905 [Planctomycetota bacterium]|nr:hypothetical protein [Planctomycetota bacterium]
MSRSPGLALAAIAAALVFTGWAIRGGLLWSTGGSTTVPWLCTALALALLVAAATGALCGRPLREIPLGVRLTVAGVASVVLGAGLIVDAVGYGLHDDWMPTAAEWAGFTVLVLLALLLPNARRCEVADEARPG